LVLRRLREGCEHERLSLDTFSERVDAAYTARNRAQLDELVSDLDRSSALDRAVSGAVGRLSRWTARLQEAWREPRTPRLALPVQRTVTLGRSPECDCVLTDPTVSRRHASLRPSDGTWWLQDLRSSNGTHLDGWRVVDEVEVRAGDRVAFGDTIYRLSPPTRAR
jgi:hypothetical protein